MFGLKTFFAALARLTAAVNESADLFATANERLRDVLTVEEDTPQLPASENGRKRVTSKV